MDLVKGAAAFIAWLSGSLAALAGILYAFGYLVTLSNLHSLGLDPLVLSFDPLFYLQRGSRFVLYVARLVFERLLDPLVLLVLVVPVFLLLRRFFGERKYAQRLGQAFGRVRAGLGAWRGLLFAALLLLLFWQMLPTYVNLTNLLTISDLLFEPCARGAVADDAGTLDLCKALTQRTANPSDAGKLRTQFLFALFFFLEAALVFYLAWRLSAGWKLRLLLVSPFAVVFAMILVSLPMIFAIVALSNEFSTVRLTAAAGEPAIEGEFYLLNKTSQEFVLWDARGERILWLPAGKLERVQIGQKRPIPLAGAEKAE